MANYEFRGRDFIFGAQMLFVAFGALVLVPILTGFDPNVALFTAGLGTLVFQLITRDRIPPIFLASSFAFIAPMIYGVQTWGIPGTLCGLFAAGLLYIVISLLIKTFGIGFLHRLLPPIVVGPVIMVIGLVLAPIAVGMAIGKPAGGPQLIPQAVSIPVSMITLMTTVAVAIFAKGVLRLIPILAGIAVGYIVSVPFGLIDLSKIASANWFSAPSFVFPEWNLAAILFIVPVAIAPAIEHFGDILAISKVTGENYLEKPGIHRTMMGDGLATSLAAFLGGPPNTTYSEVTGAVTITKMYNPAIMTWAALFAILLSFVGKLGAFLQTIPMPVMGGIMILLFGAITAIGMHTISKAKLDFSEARNISIIAIILVFGIGGMSFSAGNFTLGGIGLAGVAGIIMNLILPDKNRKTVEKDQQSG